MTNYSGNHANILRELGEITDLYNFGLQLGIDSKVLDRIDKDYRNDVRRQKSEIIKYWYRNTEESERTWGSLADAIGRLGGHSNLEAELRQLGTTPTGPGTKLRIPTTPGAASSPTAFSDDLSPTKLVSWLSQQFQAKGLALDPSLGQKLIGNTNIIHVRVCACVTVTVCVCVCACGSSGSGECYCNNGSLYTLGTVLSITIKGGILISGVALICTLFYVVETMLYSR